MSDKIPDLSKFSTEREYRRAMFSGDPVREETALWELLKEVHVNGTPSEVALVLHFLFSHYCRTQQARQAVITLRQLAGFQIGAVPMHWRDVAELWDALHDIDQVEPVVDEALGRLGWHRGLGAQCESAQQLKCLQLRIQAEREAPAAEVYETFVDLASLSCEFRAWDSELFEAIRVLDRRGIVPPPAVVILRKLWSALEKEIRCHGTGDPEILAEIEQMRKRVSERG